MQGTQWAELLHRLVINKANPGAQFLAVPL